MKRFGEIFKFIIIVMLTIILIINISIIIQTKTNPLSVPSVFGFKPFIVLSGSMESKISVGDLVIVKETNPNELKVGDIIAYRDSEGIVTTHRIVDIINKNNELSFITKGDANNTNDDNSVNSKMIEGKYKTKIAKLGNVILFIQQPTGFIIMMMTIFIICILIYIFQNKNTNKEKVFKDENERKAFEEFMKTKSQNK